MLHARLDYQRFQDPAGKIPEDEPVMLFRAQDKYAPQALSYYANILEANNEDPNIITAVRLHIKAMKEWQTNVKVKSPDLPND
jgi:hypothetical protein